MIGFRMTYDEREHLKSFADQDENLAEVVVMIAHWMREPAFVPFGEYAAQWATAHQASNVAVMREHWPLTGRRMIADDQAAWGSYGQRTTAETPYP